MHDVNGFQRDLLYVIAGMDSPHGLAVKEKLDDYYTGEVNHGRLYPNLDTLVGRGLITKGEIDDRTNSYSISEEGKQLIIERREWEAGIAKTG